MPSRNIEGVIKSKAEDGQGLTIELDSPFFETQFPTKINRIPEGTPLTVGRSIVLTLETGTLKKAKDGTPYDGSKPWMYFWNWVGIADPSAPIAEPVRGPTHNSNGPSQGRTDATGRSIERQVVLKAATEIYLAWNQHESGLGLGYVALIADELDAWLQGTPYQAPQDVAEGPPPSVQLVGEGLDARIEIPTPSADGPGL